MLLEFTCSNHRSIKEKVTFSMIAGSDNTSKEFLNEFGNIKVLRSAVIYGANGSGKSNFISALTFMLDLVGNSINYQPGRGVFQARHKLNAEDIPSEYSIKFVRNNIRYAYGFSVKQNLIQDEYLYYFPKGRPVKIFERKKLDIISGDKYKGDFKVSMSVLKENRLFLSCAANFTNINEIEEAFKFFTTDIVVYNSEINNWEEYSINLMQNDKRIKKVFVDILRELGTGVKDVKVKLEKIKFTDLPQELQLPNELKSFLKSQEGSKIEAKVVYDQFEVNLMEESTGIKRLFQMICPIIDILNTGKILICDELETSLHESIIFQLVQLFQYNQQDKFAQLIFSTHDTSLLNTDLFRRDQVWFTQLSPKERATDLYSLVEIKNVRKYENIEKGYISGKYGAIPMLNKTFFYELEKNILG